MRKFTALKTFHAYTLNAVAGEVYEVEVDDYTFNNWLENGLIEEVKEDKKKKGES
jgi:hypothetical protein